ncbi:ORF6N domain-containing protein [bacterium]|nr:ORF6N domain-containing protein [bacterium]
MLDSDLATLYQVQTKVLNQAVKRNIKRFPSDFMFQLTKEEFLNLKSQFVTSSWGGVRKMPYVFTEQGVAMLSGLLNSDIAIAVNIKIMRAFVQIRKLSVEHKDLQEQIQELKKYFLEYVEENNSEIDRINEAINLLMDRTKPRKIGFGVNEG